MGYIVGGYDTTSTTVRWAVKLLTEHQEAQNKFRESLHASLPQALSEGRQPNLEEILNMKAPYVDALLEELTR